MHIDFHPSPRATIGVEMELELVDRDTRELTSAATDVLAEMGRGHPGGEHPKAKHELLECTVEIVTGICETAGEARADLETTLAELRAATEPRRIELMCSGSHPFSDWKAQVISPNPRYHRLVEEMQWTARRLQIFGIHVHVGIRSAEKAIAIANALTAYIPHFLALSASSPYWMGDDTGLASSRSKVFEGLPTAGLPYRLAGWEHFERFMTTLVCARSITSIREVWWDIRPHPDFGTVELRICDGLPTLTEVATIAALNQCLVEKLNADIDNGDVPPVPRDWTLRLNKWRAARHGIDAEIITDEDGTLGSLREELVRLVDDLLPWAERLGCGRELTGVADILSGGPSYIRQRRVVQQGGSLVDVVDSLVAELRAGSPAATRRA